MIGPPLPPNNQDRVAAAVEASGPTREQLVAELAELKRQVSEHQAIDRRRRETEEALRESQRKLFTLMGNLPGMVYRCRNDKDWTMEFVSDGCLNLTGYPPDYILWNRKKSYSQLIHLEDQDYVWNCIQTALKRNAPFRLTYRITNSGGNVRWVLERGIGIFDEAGRLIALEGFVTDVTERKLSEEALRKSEEKYRIITENATDIIWIVDLYGRFQVVSPSLERVLGYTLEEATSLTLRQILTRDSYKRAMMEIEKRLSHSFLTPGLDQDPAVLELEYLKKDGSKVWCEVTTKFLSDSTGRTMGITGITRDISLRKQAEENLIREKNFSETVINSLPGIFYIFDADGNLVRWNDNLETVTDYSFDEISVMTAFDLFSHENKPKATELLWDAFSKNKFSLEIDLLTKSGRKIPYFLTGIRNHIDDYKYILGVGIDITKRKRTEIALRESEERYRSVFENTGTATIMVEADMTISMVNSEWEKLSGYTGSEIEHKMKWTQFAAPEDMDRLKDYHTRRRTGDVGVPMEFEFRFVNRAGNVRDVLNKVFMVPGTEKSISSMLDITERKRVEENFRRTSEQLSVLLESLPIVPYTCRADGDFATTYVGNTVVEMTGYTPEQFLERSTFWAAHIHPDDRKKVFTELPELTKHGKWQYEYRFRTEDGRYKWFRDIRRMVGLPDGSISHIVGTWQDITEEKKLRQEAEYRLQQVIQADKLASLGEVVAGVAHEINNPNNFITSNIPLMEETWVMLEPILCRYATANPDWTRGGFGMAELCQDMHEMIEAVKAGSDRINRVVNNLKDFARVDEAGHPEPVDVNEVIEKTFNIVGAQVRKLVGRIEIDLSPSLPEISGHFQKLEQVAANLLVNGAQAIPEKSKGLLRITTKYLPHLNSVLLAVEDNGIGMEPSVREQIFEPFFTTKRTTGGTGLGLSVSYGLVREHRGIIGVLSKPGIGTRFAVLLPVNQVKPLDLRPVILCVDDDARFLAELRSYMAGDNAIAVETISRPDLVVDYLHEHPETDVVVSEIMTIGVSGWNLLERVKREFPLVSVMLYSGNPICLNKQPGVTADPDLILQKPFKMREFIDALNTLDRQIL